MGDHLHRGGPARPRPWWDEPAPGRTFLRGVPPPLMPAAAGLAGGQAGRRARRSGGRPLPGRITSRTPREPWRSYAKNVRAEPGGWHLPGPRLRCLRRAEERARGQATPPPRPAAGGAVTIATGLQAQSAVYSQMSARKFGREAARRTSLGWGVGRGRREEWTGEPGAPGGREGERKGGSPSSLGSH